MSKNTIINLTENQLKDIISESVAILLAEKHLVLEGKRGRKPKSTNDKGEQLYYISIDGEIIKVKHTREEAIRIADMYIDRGHENVRLVKVE